MLQKAKCVFPQLLADERYFCKMPSTLKTVEFYLYNLKIFIFCFFADIGNKYAKLNRIYMSFLMCSFKYKQ